MKKYVILILTVILAFALCSCGKPVEEKPQSEEPAHSFDIRYCEWIVPGNEGIYDTKNGILQKDLVTAGTASCELSVSEEIKQQIYDKAVNLDIMSITKNMTSENLAKGNMLYGVEPCREYEIILYIDGVEYKITGDDTAEYYSGDKEAKHFWEFRTYMHELLWQSEEFKNLPDAVGGYE